MPVVYAKKGEREKISLSLELELHFLSLNRQYLEAHKIHVMDQLFQMDPITLVQNSVADIYDIALYETLSGYHTNPIQTEVSSNSSSADKWEQSGDRREERAAPATLEESRVLISQRCQGRIPTSSGCCAGVGFRRRTAAVATADSHSTSRAFFHCNTPNNGFLLNIIRTRGFSRVPSKQRPAHLVSYHPAIVVIVALPGLICPCWTGELVLFQTAPAFPHRSSISCAVRP
jgi:hypothetical protein